MKVRGYYLLALWLVLQTVALADLTLERKVNMFITDTVGRKRKIVRCERVKIKDGNVRVEDLTFGEVVIIRTDKKLVWKIDTLEETYSEVSFERIQQRRREIMNEIQATLKAVAGTEEERRLQTLLNDLAGGNSQAKLEIRDLGQVVEIAGVRCKEKQIMLEDRILMKGFFAEGVNEVNTYFEALAAIHAVSPSVGSQLTAFRQLLFKGDFFNYVIFADRITASEEVTSISREKISGDDFKLPQQLKPISIPWAVTCMGASFTFEFPVWQRQVPLEGF